MPNAGGAYVELVPKVAGNFASQVSTELEGPVRSAGTQLSGLLKGALVVGGGLALGAELKNFFAGSIAEATEAYKVGQQTDAVLKSTAGAAGISAGAVESLATQLSGVSGVDDEVIQQGENVLLTFTSVKNAVGAGNDVFNQATTAALDMSKALGTDLQGSVIQIGKALNDPIQGMTALRRVGVSFTEDQKNQIKALQESGDLLGAQKIVLAELQKEFGGAAAAVATPWEKLNVQLKNVEESVGTALQPAISALAPALGTVLTALAPVITGLGTALAPVIQALAPVFVALGPPIAQILGLLGQLLVPVAQLVAALAPIVALVLQLASTFLAALMPAITPIIGVLTQVVGVIAQALKPVIAEIVPIIQQNAGVYVSLVQAVLPIIPALGQILVALLPLLPPLIELATIQLRLIGLLAPFIALLAQVAAVMIGALAGAITTVVGFIRNDLIGTVESLPGKVGGALDAVVGFFAGLPGRIGGFLGDVFSGLWEGFKHFVNLIIRGWNSLHFDIPEVDLGPLGNIGGGRIQFPQIPYLAKGTTNFPGGLAFIAENGPELVNLPRGATVTPLDNGNAALAAGGYVVEVPVYLDGREIARAQAPYGPEAERRYRRARQ